MTLIDAQSSTHGPTGSKTPLDMISNFGNGRLVLLGVLFGGRRAAVVIALGLIGATVVRTFARLPIDIR